ncbi:MAG: prephenate/arogenate dehydrogenase family protein [Alphaproteobacteria bacterium]|nr:prephenate/arogenate dehydrogenase family protein [Alphaproteobacteria bacterium]
MNVMFQKVAMLGLGLIGSSLCLAMRKHGLAQNIVGYAKTPETRQVALEIGLVDQVYATAAEAVCGADLVIMCVPVGACGQLAQEIGPHLSPGAILTDVGSVKGTIVRDCASFVPQGVHFVPGHPIAGTEQSGPRSGFAELFENRWCILTPLAGGDAAATAKLEAFWQACGSNTELMTPDHHDLVLAITSHLPHLIAYTTVATASDLESVTDTEVIKYSASGFRDFTRIAASDPTMWRDVFLNNKEAVLEMLGRFTEELAVLQRAVRWGDGETLFNLFTRAREARRNIIAAGQDTASPDFGRVQKKS